MKLLALLIAPLALLCAATITVSTPGTDSVNVQTALTSAVCGDTVEFAAGVVFDNPFNNGFVLPALTCTDGNELILTTSRAAWLPTSRTRITPGHRANLPEFRYGAIQENNAPLFLFPNGATGYKVIGLYVRGGGDTQSSPVFGVGQNYPTLASQLTDNITIDRILGEGDYNTTTMHGNWLYANSKRVSLINNFVTDWHRDAGETHFYLQDTGDKTSLKLVDRNYSSTFTEHYFTGGNGGPTFPTGSIGNVLLQRNIAYNAPKWYTEHPDYNGSASTACIKNALEFKDIFGAVIRHNSAYNIWQNCGSQYPTWQVSLRMNGQWMGGSFTLGTGAAGANSKLTLSLACCTGYTPGNGNGNTWIETYSVTAPGQMLCLPKDSATQTATSSNWECHTIVSADTTNKVYEVDTPFTTAYTLGINTGLYYLKVMGAQNSANRVTLVGNYAENVGSLFRFTTVDDSVRIPGAQGIGGDFTAFDNFALNVSTYMNLDSHGVSFHFSRFDEDSERVRFERNAMYNTPLLTGLHNGTTSGQNYEAVGIAYTNDYNGGLQMYDFTFRSNMFFGGQYSTGLGIPNSRMSADSRITHNGVMNAGDTDGINYHMTTSCTGGRLCVGNILSSTWNPGYRDWANGDFRLAANSAYRRAGYDGRDMGPRPGSFPSIQNLTTAVTSNSASVAWEVPYILQDEVATLECTTSRNIHSDLGSFTVVNDLNPSMFIRRDSDEFHPGASATFGKRKKTWTFGGSATVTDDNGVSRSRALAANTLHYCRLLQGGAMKHFTFTTLP